MSPDRVRNGVGNRIRVIPSLKFGPFAIALALQGILLLGTAYVIVFVPSMKTEPEFSTRKTIYLPQRELEHCMAVAEHEQAVSPPVMLEKLTTAALLPDTLPKLPSLPRIEYNFNDDSNPAAEMDVLLGVFGLNAALRALNSETSRASLFGIEDSGERILLLFDDGGSVINKARRSGVPISAIRKEAIRVIDGLNANTLFGLIRFVRRVGTFQDILVPATRENKRIVNEWIENTLATGKKKRTELTFAGSGIEAALEDAFQMEPDVIFLLSDADFQRYAAVTGKGEEVPWDDVSDALRRLRREASKNVRVNFIGFQVRDDDRKEMRRLVRRTGGEVSGVLI